MLSRVKQFRDHSSPRIDTGQVCAFVQIAINTREGEIVEVVPATMDLGNDMFEVKGS